MLGDSYRTTWQEVLAEHFSEPLGEEATSQCETKEDFDRAIALFIKKTLNNEKPRDLQYIYMQPGGDYRLTKDLVTPPRLHAQRFKEMLRVAELLPAGDFPKPSDALALQWYYMSYHKSDRKKYVLGEKTLKDATFESVTTFFQVLYEQIAHGASSCAATISDAMTSSAAETADVTTTITTTTIVATRADC